MDWSKRINPENLLWAGYLGMFFFLPVATSPTVICGVVILAAWILSGRLLKDLAVWCRSEITLPLMFIVVLPWIGLLYTPSPEDGFPVAMKSHYWLYAMALPPLLSVQSKPDLPIRMFLAGLSLNSMISLLQFVGTVPLKKGLAIGLLGGSSAHIAYSLLLATGILIGSFYFSRARQKKDRILYGSLMLQYLLTIGFTGGRSGYVALIILSPLVIYNLIRKPDVGKILVVSMVAVSLLFTFPVVRSRFMEARKDIVLYKQGTINTSLGLRLHMWEIALSEIKRHPLSGVGTAGFRQSWEVQKKDTALPFIDHPHNSFLYMLVSFGLLGLVAFCWLLFLVLKRGWKSRDSPLGFAVFTFTAVFAIGSLTDTQVLPFATALAFPLFTGMSEAAEVR